MCALLGLSTLGCGNPAAPVLPAVSRVHHHDESFLRAYKDLSGEQHKTHDPVSIVGLNANDSWAFDWPEHPLGRVDRRTNNFGLSHDAPVGLDKSGYRILVAGDSHTEGVVSNPESFVAKLRESGGGGDVEALNAGVGYMGPYCYLGALRKYACLSPDLFIAVFYAGNDLMDDLRVAYIKGEHDEPSVGEEYYAPLREAEKAWAAPCWQGVNQIYRFTKFPHEAELALDAAASSFLSIADLCREQGTKLLVVILPTKYDADVEDQREEFALLARHLGLSDDDMGLNRRLAAEMERRLTEKGIECLDVTGPFMHATELLYWRRDHHLNVNGHAKLAELIGERLAQLRGTRSR